MIRRRAFRRLLGAAVPSIAAAIALRANRAQAAGNTGAATPGLYLLQSSGARGDGRHDDTPAIQAAIDALADGGGGELRFEPAKVYSVASLKPRSHVMLNLRGSTLRLRDRVDAPLIFDHRSVGGPVLNGFGIRDGRLDCNMQANTAGNLSAGAIWLSDWRDVRIERVEIRHAFRNAINLWACERVIVCDVDVLDCGMPDSSHYSYGIALEPSCRFVSIRRFRVADMWGFGLYLRDVQHFDLDGLHFERLRMKAHSAIAVTLDSCRTGRMANVFTAAVDGDAIEINNCQDCTIENLELRDTADLPLVMGNNGQGPNERIRISQVIATGTGGPHGLRASFIRRCRFSGLDLDKPANSLAAIADDRGNLVEDSRFAGSISRDLIWSGKFSLARVGFDNVHVERAGINRLELANPRQHGQMSIGLPAGTALLLDLAQLLGGTQLSESGQLAGRIRLIAWHEGNHSGIHEYLLLAGNAGGISLEPAGSATRGSAPRLAISVGQPTGIHVSNQSVRDCRLCWQMDLSAMHS